MLNELLARGYLPQELPPIFTSSLFAHFAQKGKSSLPADFTKSKAVWTKPLHHNFARVGGLRRRLSTPNPISYFRLASAFDSHSKVLEKNWASTSYSQTMPKLQISGKRAIAPDNPDRALPRALARVGARYVLRADIAQFYPSIYTHTVPWALHSKKTAKSKWNDMTLAGNVLDKELQASQDGQTKGIPIGPDTSLGIAELLLAPIDAEMLKVIKPIGGVRFIDDMEFYFTNVASAERAAAFLEARLHEYELQLNTSKTALSTLPDVFDSRYVTELRSSLPGDGTTSRSSWIDYFNKAFDLARTYPADGVLRYAIAALQTKLIPKKNWELVQSLLWQSVVGDPGCLRFAIDIILNNTNSQAGIAVDKQMAKRAIESIVRMSAPIGHGSEVIWSMWAALLLNVRLSQQSSKLIWEMDDPYVAVLAQLATDKKVFSNPPSPKKWLGWISEDSFRSENWLWVYEAYHRGWAKSQVKSAHISSDPVCKSMHEAGVSFLDEAQIEIHAAKKMERKTLNFLNLNVEY